MSVSAKSILKSALFATGGLDLYRRAALSDTLTVAMFHRVLPPTDPRYTAADPKYTMRLEIFEHCLDFFHRHYVLVSLGDIENAVAAGHTLPKRAMLITLDDGWEDTAGYAAPALRRRKMPSVVFVASDALKSETTLWQDVAACVWRCGASVGHPSPDGLIAWLETLNASDRAAWLKKAIEAKPEAFRRIMMNEDDLRRVAADGMTIGGHGASHTPLTKVDDLASELARCAGDLKQATSQTVSAFSFPHGSYSPAVTTAVRQAGFKLQFSSDPCLNPTSSGIPSLFGRLDIPEHEVVDERGEFAAEKLAYWLAARPIRALSHAEAS